MAGKRQHYVPRLLQRGFLNDPSDEAERTWLHRRGANARLVSIRHVGVEDWFYSRKSHDGTLTLDDAITDLECDLAASVRAMRTSAPGSPLDAAEAAHTLVHLVMRTAHLRQLFSAGMTSIMNKIESVFADPERVAELLGLNDSAPSAVVLGQIRDAAEKLAPAGIPRAFSERIMAYQLRELGDRFVEQTVAMFGSLFPQLLSGLTGNVRDAHNAVLATSPTGNRWVTALADFVWTVEAGANLILPDAVALAREDKGPLMPLLFTKATDVRIAVMPVSSERILVGRSPDSTPIDLGNFNAQAAACCDTFFVGAKPFEEEKLTVRIGSAIFHAIEDTISAAVHEAEQARSTAGEVSDLIEPHVFSEQGFSFNVRVVGFGDEVLAKELADVLHGMVSTLVHELPLHDLDGFTLAGDYEDALSTIDRGDTDLPSVTSESLNYGQGVAKLVTVIREGVRKEHLVIDASVAMMWLSPDAKERAIGLHTLVKMLAGVAHSTRYVSVQETSFTPDAMGRTFHQAVDATPAKYWSARKAAFIEPDQGQAYAELVIAGLDVAEREIAEERTRIAEHGDIGNITMRALECASAVVGHTADWLGHRDGLAEGQVFAGSDLPERLKARGLDHWIELLGRDLAACYGQRGAVDFKIVAGLSQHVERLFWSLGIYCWPDDEDVRCVVTDQPLFPPRPP